MCVRYKRNNHTTDSPQHARDINETIELDNPQRAREINETIKLQTVLSVGDILTKQSN